MKAIESFSVVESFGMKDVSIDELMDIEGGKGTNACEGNIGCPADFDPPKCNDHCWRIRIGD